MNIEDLSKTQLLLLTILVNFVTSIATGVLTVSLLDQAPQTVTQTVNRIVDHTIQTVTTQVPVVGSGSHGPTTEDLLTSAIAADSASVVRLYQNATTTPVVALGTYLPSAHAVIIVSNNPLPTDLIAQFNNGAALSVSQGKTQGSLVAYTFAGGATPPQIKQGKLLGLSDIKQGQTAIALTSDGTAATGIITKVGGGAFTADLPGIPAGSPLVNLSGDIIGINTGDTSYLPGSSLTAFLAGAQ